MGSTGSEVIWELCCFEPSTAILSCAVKWNMQTLLDYLKGATNVCAMSDPNHNGNSVQFQLFTGLCAAIIVHYVVDPFLLQEADIVKDLYCP